MTNELFDRLTLGSSYQRLFAFCKGLGISRINVEYSGGGDSGGMDSIEVIPKSIDKEVVNFIRNNLEEELSNPIYDRHGSFADGGGYSVNGTVVYDIANNKAWIEGTDHFYEYNDSENEDEEGEETSSDEAWVRMLYDHEDEDELGDEREYEFALHYAKLTNKPFPDAIHNQMSAAAITGDENAKEYMAWAKKN